MSGGLNIYGMISGIGDTFDKSYEAGLKAKQDRDAGDLFGKMIGMQSAASAAPAITMGTLGQDAGPKVPTFAGAGGAMGDYLATTRAKESGGNDLAANPNSTAKGRYQFTNSTWQSVARAHPELGLQPGGWSDPAQQEKAMAAFTSDNANVLSKAGIPIDPGNLYVAHFLGAGGAQKFIPGAINNPDAPATAFVTPGAARANRTIFFNRDGSPKTAGEVYAERTGRFVNREPVATPTLPAGGAVAGVPSMMSAGAPATMPVSPARPTGARVPTFLGSQAQGGFDPNALPTAPTAVASAQASPEADMPVAGAQPAQFQIPGQPAPAATPAPAAAPVAQGFAGMGGGTSRISPEQAEILKQAWRNPNTRAMATSVYQSILQGKDSPWSLQDVNGQSAWVNKQTQAIVPVGQAKRQTATVGNSVIDLSTGQPIYSAPEKDDKFTYQSMPGVGMVALHPSDPSKSRVIIAGQQPRPFTDDERQAWRVPQDSSVGMGADGKPFTIGGAKTEVKIDTKGAGKFAEKANEIQAKRYGEMVDAADRAVPLRADIDTLANLGAQIGTGKFTEARAGLAQYAKAAGLDSVADGLVGGKLGEIEAFGSLVDKLTPQMRVPGSGATSDREGASFKNSLPSLLRTPEGNAVIADTFRGMADYQAQVGDLAGKALRGEISQSEADQAIKTLPSPYQRLKEYQGAQKAAPSEADSSSLPKGEAREALPKSYSSDRAVFEAKKAVSSGKDKGAIAEWLKARGIDPKRLDQ